MTESSTVIEDQGANADSPAANEVQGEQTLLDAVKAGLEGQEAAPPSAVGDKQDAQASAEQPEASADPSEDELKQMKPRTAERIRALVDQRREAQQQVETFRGDAEKFRNLQSFVQAEGLQENDVADAMEFLSLVKKNPAEALKRLNPIVQQLRGTVGEDLPADLSEQVRLGYVTESAAQELSRLRANQTFAQQREQERQQASEAQHHARERQAFVDASRNAVDTWEARQRASDPDWQAKADRVRDRLDLEVMRAIRDGKPPKTAGELVQYAEKALEAVNDDYRRFAPQRPGVRVPSGQSSGRAIAEPKTALEAARLALQNMG